VYVDTICDQTANAARIVQCRPDKSWRAMLQPEFVPIREQLGKGPFEG